MSSGQAANPRPLCALSRPGSLHHLTKSRVWESIGKHGTLAIMLAGRRRVWVAGAVVLFVVCRIYVAQISRPAASSQSHQWQYGSSLGGVDPQVLEDTGYFWRQVPTHYPVESMRPLPTGPPLALPKVQAGIEETAPEKQVRVQRQGAVKQAFRRCWRAYEELALPHDELMPISGKPRDTFGTYVRILSRHQHTLTCFVSKGGGELRWWTV
jgi:hypothetical protein